jgi:maleate cis-trans isomerase
MPSAPLRVGLIVPSSNTVMEPDFHQHLPGTIVSTTRILLEQVTRDAEFRMLEEDLPRAAQLIKTTAPDIVVFGCTSAGSLDGLAYDDGIGKRRLFVSSNRKWTAPPPTVYFLSCTNWQALEAIEPLRKKLGIPVI